MAVGDRIILEENSLGSYDETVLSISESGNVSTKLYNGRVVDRNIDITIPGYSPSETDIIQVLPDSDIVEGDIISLSINEGTPVDILGYTSHDGNYSIILTYLTDYWGLLGRQAESYTVSGVNTGDQILPVKATGTELNTGTDDTKFATAKALKDGKFIGIHVGTTAPTDTTLLWLDTN